MKTEAPSSDSDDHASPYAGSEVSDGRNFRWQYLIVGLAAYLVAALLGIYADWKFWSYFDLEYLRYASFGDYLLAPVSFLRMVVAPSFITVFVVFGIGLLLVAAGCGYVFRVLWNFMQHARSGREPVRGGDTLPLTEHWEEDGPVRSYLRTLAARPLWAVPIVAVAAILAINIGATAERRDIRSFAALIQHAYANDRYRRLRPPYLRYELVSVGLLAPTERREHLVRLRSTDGFVFYYDVLDDQPLVVSANRVSSEVANANLADWTPPASASGELAAGPAETAGDTSIQTAGDAPDRGAPDSTTPPMAHSSVTEFTLPAQQSSASEAAQPARGSASPIKPAAEAGDRVTTGQGPNPEVSPVVDTAAGDAPGGSPAGTPPQQHPEAPAEGSSTLPVQQSAAPGSVGPHEEVDAIGTNVRQSEGSLEGLKAQLQQMEGNIAEIHKLINELDGDLKQIDQASGRLAAHQAASERDTYADCPELTAGQPIQFGAGDATLSLEAVGWLFQSRRQLIAPRSVERRQWLVIEGHADTAGQPESPLSNERTNAVREFLQSELGVSPDVIKVVSKSVTGSNARFVSIYDCLQRQPATGPPATTAAGELGLVPSAAAREVAGNGQAAETEQVRPAVRKPGEDAGGGLRPCWLTSILSPRSAVCW